MPDRSSSTESPGRAGLDRRAFCGGAALAGLGLMTGCWRTSGDAPRVGAATELSAQELRFGVAPAVGGAIRYQPEVLIVRGGPAAIRDAGDDGMTWAIDAGAGGASGIRPGQVLLVTDRCAGRVLAMRRTADLVVVLLGPVELTEVIRDCDLQLEQPVDFGRAAVYAAPGFPGGDLRLEPTAPWRDLSIEQELAGHPASPHGAPAFAHQAHLAPSAPWLQPVADGPGALRIGVTPEVGADGIGIRTAASNSLVNISFVAKLRLSAPRLQLHLKIGAGRIEQAMLRLSGAAGLRLGFIATSEGDYRANIRSNGRLVPVDMVLPILLNIGSPLGLSLHQRFFVQSGFSARQSVLKAIGDYGLSGDLHFGYQQQRFQAGGPVLSVVNDGMIQGMRNISVGVSAMVLAHQVRVMAGIGALGFRVGPYIAMTSSVGVSQGSWLARPVQPNVCRAATLVLSVAPGIGWQIPQLAADAANVFLGLLGQRKIANTGGIHGSALEVFRRTAYMPTTQVCRDAAGGGGPSGSGGPPPPSDPRPPQGPASGADAAPGPGAPAADGVRGSAPDLDAACGDEATRRALERAGLDTRRLCAGAGRAL